MEGTALCRLVFMLRNKQPRTQFLEVNVYSSFVFLQPNIFSKCWKTVSGVIS